MAVTIAEIKTIIPKIINPNSSNISNIITSPSSDFKNEAEAKNKKNRPPISNNHFLNHILIRILSFGSVFGLTIFPLTVTIISISFYPHSDMIC